MYLRATDGTQIYYQVEGQFGAPTIVFVGGFCISSVCWQQQLALQHDFRLFALSARYT